jgi:hypothetical protein
LFLKTDDAAVHPQLARLGIKLKLTEANTVLVAGFGWTWHLDGPHPVRGSLARNSELF